jgi:hypothetical protein
MFEVDETQAGRVSVDGAGALQSAFQQTWIQIANSLKRGSMRRLPALTPPPASGALLTQTSKAGGSMQTDATAVAVMRCHPPSSARATMLTVAAK